MKTQPQNKPSNHKYPKTHTHTNRKKIPSPSSVKQHSSQSPKGEISNTNHVTMVTNQEADLCPLSSQGTGYPDVNSPSRALWTVTGALPHRGLAGRGRAHELPFASGDHSCSASQALGSLQIWTCSRTPVKLGWGLWAAVTKGQPCHFQTPCLPAARM